ncbi:MAG: hypothetical protein QM718_13970 [Steroidobacteraceae bacterium]
MKRSFEIVSGAVHGYLPRRTLALVQEGRLLRQGELINAWNAAESRAKLPFIDPLE